ncbi:NERD domain-containing protein [Acinetobacter baumannii]
MIYDLIVFAFFTGILGLVLLYVDKVISIKKAIKNGEAFYYNNVEYIAIKQPLTVKVTKNYSLREIEKAIIAEKPFSLNGANYLAKCV